MARPGTSIWVDRDPVSSVSKAAQEIGCTVQAIYHGLKNNQACVIKGHLVSMSPPVRKEKAEPLLAPGYCTHRLGVYHGQRI